MTDRSADTVAEYVGDGELNYRTWRTALADGVLLGQRCGDCGSATGTPKAACPDCGSRALAPETLPTTGAVYTETEIAVPPAGFPDGYTVALVQLGDATVMGRLEDTVTIDDTVTLAGVCDEDTYPAPLFEPESKRSAGTGDERP